MPRRLTLDGLRGLAILAVIGFHLPTRRFLPAGFVGVDVFFVLSGFLITALLLQEHADHRRIAFGRFYVRRARRLLPALVVFLASWLVVRLLFGGQRWFWGDPFSPHGVPAIGASSAARGAGMALLYSFNWARARHWALPPLGHLWSLSVEGQFYVLWPLLIGALVRSRRRDLLVPCTAALAAVSAALPFLFWHHGRGADRIYFGSDTRAQALLFGALIAELWSTGALQRAVSVRIRAGTAAAGGAILLVLAARLQDTRFKYVGGLTVSALAGAAVVAYLVDDRRDFAGRVLASRPLRWLGERSYGLYLWHWALVSWTAALPLPVGIPLALVGSLAVTEASWRFLERPLLVSGRRPRAGAPVVRWRWRGAMVDVGAQPASAGRPM